MICINPPPTRRIQSTKHLQNSSGASRAQLQTCNAISPGAQPTRTYGRSAFV
jgi:hypothetical protein